MILNGFRFVVSAVPNGKDVRLRAIAVGYVVALVVFCGLDFAWLSFAGETIYRAAIGELLRPDFAAAPAAAFYIIYVGGLVVLAIRPASSSMQAILRGAVYGFCAYATYDLTNQATLNHWPMSLSLVDLAWGTLLSAVAAACGYGALAAYERAMVSGGEGGAKKR